MRATRGFGDLSACGRPSGGVERRPMRAPDGLRRDGRRGPDGNMALYSAHGRAQARAPNMEGTTVLSTADQSARGVFSEIERVFALQQAHQWEMKATNAGQRKEKLRKLKAAVEAHQDEIIAAVKQDTRKPENEVRVTEVLNVLANIQRNIDNVEEWMKPVEVTPSLNEKDEARNVYEARGVCLILGPWNFPLGLVLGPLAAAVAAGNCCIVKLTDLCPATASVAAKIIRDAFDEKEVALFEGGVDVASALLELPFNHIFFTGSTRVGKIVMAAAAKHLATVTLELGGKSPVIVDEDADLEMLAEIGG